MSSIELGKTMDLFISDDDLPGGGLIFTQRGTKLFDNIQKSILKIIGKNYKIIRTPAIANDMLWEKSGHKEKYIDNMWCLGNKYYLKPMSCPMHYRYVKYDLKSYKQLPYRVFEFGNVFRKEESGAVQELFRLYNFTQDDGHIFVDESNMESEIYRIIKEVLTIYEKIAEYDLSKIKILISTRPKKYHIGDEKSFDMATEKLKIILNKYKISYELDEGGGAFYGPKIDFSIMHNDKYLQLGTIQLDIYASKNFNLYVNDANQKIIFPMIIHRAACGSIERFIGSLLIMHNGYLPIHLNPNPSYLLAMITEGLNLDKLKSSVTIIYIKDKNDLKNNLKDIYVKRPNKIYFYGEKEKNADFVKIKSYDKDNTWKDEKISKEQFFIEIY